VGLPLVQRTPTKFLLTDCPIGSADVSAEPLAEGEDAIEMSLKKELNKCGENGEHLQVFEVEKIYVLIGDCEDDGPKTSAPAAAAPTSSSPTCALQYSFIRRRSQKGFSVFGHTTVSTHPSGERVEVKRIITKREYEWMKSMYADSSRNVVVQRRYCFLWEGKTFSLYRYLEPLNSLCILHCQAAWKPKDSEPEEEVESSVTFPPFLNVKEPLNEDGKFSAYHLSLKEEPSN
jgi:hypothetical protein